MTTNLRPGVYSTYTVDGSYATPRSRLHAALAGTGAPALAGTVHSLAGVEAARSLLGGDPANAALLAAAELLLESGVSRVVLSAIGDSLAEALDLLLEEEDVGFLACKAPDAAGRAALAEFLQKREEGRRETIAFLGADSAAVAAESAAALNNPRAVICCPGAGPAEDDTDGLYAAAAMAGAVAAQADPVHNWNNQALPALAACGRLEEAEIQSLLAAGVTVLEQRAGEVRCIRAMTTKTKTGGVADATLRSLNTILIIDDVMRTVRDSLNSRLRGTRVSAETVKAQVTVELAAKRDQGIIESFAVPRADPDPADPAVCVVELSFRAAHVLSQIHVKAHIAI